MTSLFQTGGPVGERRYLERPADRELPKALREGQLCALFAPRQEGKTSLMLRTSATLAAEGVRCCVIDIGMLSPANASVEDLFVFLASEIGSAIGEPNELPAAKSPASAFVAWMTEVGNRSAERISIFIDEIHQMLDAPKLSSELFQVLGVLFDQGRTPKIAYCVAGVARPQDLVHGAARNPFATGRLILLEDFTLDEMAPLRADFVAKGAPAEFVDEVYRWTSGHPSMTLKLAREIEQECEARSQRRVEVARDELPAALRRAEVVAPEKGSPPLDVDPPWAGQAKEPDLEPSRSSPNPSLARAREMDVLVERTILAEAYATENYLADARLLFDGSARFGDADLGDAVALYRRLLRRESVRESDAGENGVVLVLAGLAAARTRGGTRMLEPRNLVTKQLFDEDCIDRMEVARRLDKPLRRWLSLERAPSALLGGADLQSAVAIARRAREVTPEQRDLLLLSLEVEKSRAVAAVEMDAARRSASDAAQLEALTRSSRGGTIIIRVLSVIGLICFVALAIVTIAWREAEVARARSEELLLEKTQELEAKVQAIEDLTMNATAERERADAAAKEALVEDEVLRAEVSQVALANMSVATELQASETHRPAKANVPVVPPIEMDLAPEQDANPAKWAVVLGSDRNEKGAIHTLGRVKAKLGAIRAEAAVDATSGDLVLGIARKGRWYTSIIAGMTSRTDVERLAKAGNRRLQHGYMIVDMNLWCPGVEPRPMAVVDCG